MKATSAAIGEFEIVPLFDGTLATGLEKIPDPEDRAAAARLAGVQPDVPIVFNVYGFLIRGPEGLALVDAGSGDKKGPTTGRLLDSLVSVGASREAIDRIYMTHWHGDHFGGLTDGAGSAVFPRAEVVVTEPEARFWFDTSPELMPARAQRALGDARAALAPYKSRLRVTPKDGSYRGLSAVPSPGHTPGHTCWLIASGDKMALIWGDVIHIEAIHLKRPRTAFEYDLDPLLAGETRARILERVARERMLVAGAHLDGSGLGYLLKEGDAFQLEPLGR